MLMEENTKEIGQIILKMDKVMSFMPMEKNCMKENGMMGKLMDKVLSIGKMVKNSKGNGKVERNMVKAQCFMLMEGYSTEVG